MKILFVSPWYPDPPDNGAKIRITNLLDALCSRHEVTLIAAYDPTILPPARHNDGALAACQKVIPVPWLPQPISGMRRLASFVWTKSGWVLFKADPGMAEAIKQIIQTNSFDLVINYELSTLNYLSAYMHLPTILEDVELGGYLPNANQTTMLGRWRRHLFFWKLRRTLQSVAYRISAYTVPSPAEERLLRRILPEKAQIQIVPNCLNGKEYDGFTAISQPNRIIFTGSLTFHANYEAVSLFLLSVYPFIKLELPDIEFVVTGRSDGVMLSIAEQDASVKLAGFVEDVRPWIASSQVAVVPLYTGGGTRFKILEALALGIPVVSTTKGAEGLAIMPGRHLLIADTPPEFAAAVIRLFRDQAMRERLITAGKQLVTERYTWQTVAPRYLAWIDQVAQENHRRSNVREIQ